MRIAFANLDADDAADAGAVAAAFADVVEDPPWRALADAGGLVAWRADHRAYDEAQRRGVRLWGTPLEAARRASDGAFAAQVAKAQKLDAPIAALVADLNADQMSTATIEATVARWPAWARARFAVVARRGERTVVGTHGTFRFDNVEGLTIFRRAHGGLVMPWPERRVALTTCFLVDAHGEPHHLGAAAVRAAGGFAITCDDGGLSAGTDVDDAALERARAVADAAAQDGYRGALAVDAFTWLDDGGDARLRGVAWLHARFTRAHLALALVARQAPRPGARFVVDHGGGALEELPS